MNMNNKFTFIAELCQNHNGKFKNIEKMLSDCAYNVQEYEASKYISKEK